MGLECYLVSTFFEVFLKKTSSKRCNLLQMPSPAPARVGFEYQEQRTKSKEQRQNHLNKLQDDGYWILDARRAADDLTESGGPVRVGSSDIGYLILDIYIGLFQVVSS